MATNKKATTKAPRSDFDKIGTKDGTYLDVLDAKCLNIDTNEKFFMAQIFGSIWRRTGQKYVYEQLKKCSCAGLLHVANYCIQVVEQLCNPSYFTSVPAMHDHECLVCGEKLKQDQEIMVTDCDHVYHQGCLTSWFWETCGSENCGLCRRHIDRVRCGRYDETTKRMIADKIRMLCAEPGHANLWKVVQIEYKQDEPADRKHPDFARIIYDKGHWFIVGRDSMDNSLLPVVKGHNRIFHPLSAGYTEWRINCQDWINKRNRYLEHKKMILPAMLISRKECPLPTSLRNAIEGLIPSGFAHDVRKTIPEDQECNGTPKTKPIEFYKTLRSVGWPTWWKNQRIIPCSWCWMMALAIEDTYLLEGGHSSRTSLLSSLLSGSETSTLVSTDDSTRSSSPSSLEESGSDASSESFSDPPTRRSLRIPRKRTLSTASTLADNQSAMDEVIRRLSVNTEIQAYAAGLRCDEDIIGDIDVSNDSGLDGLYYPN